MLISYLAVRTIVLPYQSLEDMYRNTDHKLIVQPGSFQVNLLSQSSDPVIKTIYEERVAPYIDDYPHVIDTN